MASERYYELVNGLVELLVKEIRLLQSMADLGQKERDTLLHGDSAALVLVVEEKEAVIDQLVLLEEARQTYLCELAAACNLAPPPHSIQELLPYLKPDMYRVITRLTEGISALAGQAREMNHGNQTLAEANLKWVLSLQGFLMNLSAQEENYHQAMRAALPPVQRSGDLDARV